MTQKKQILCDLRVLFGLFNCQTPEYILGNTFKAVEDITDVHQMTNEQLKQIIQKIEVDKEGNVDIFLRLFGDLGPVFDS